MCWSMETKCLNCNTLPDDLCCRTAKQALFELELQRMSVYALNFQITLFEINITFSFYGSLLYHMNLLDALATLVLVVLCDF